MMHLLQSSNRVALSFCNRRASSFSDLASSYEIELRDDELNALSALPELRIANVSSVLLAIEAKAAMTAFSKALPRLKDELTSSFQSIHGDSESAIAAGVVLVNMAREFVSPDQNKFDLSERDPVVSSHAQPRSASHIVDGLRDIQRRSKVGDTGFDGLGVLLVDCRNDGISPVTVNTSESSVLKANDDFEYSRFIKRLAHLYATRFKEL